MKVWPIIVLISVMTAALHAQTNLRSDSSDWWSINREDPGRPVVEPSDQELKASSFKIGGFTLGADFDAIAAMLGKATVVERGDGSIGRSQVCYQLTNTGTVHLVFEFGEDESVFYIFSSPRPWEGEKYCIAPKAASGAFSTASGLKLGLPRADVEKILGDPDAATTDSLIYARQSKQKASKREFEILRSDYPEKLSEEEAHTKFDFYPVEQYVLARFADSKLIYLAVSISGGVD